MIRKIVDWFAYLLHIKKRIYKPALESILELLPLLIGVGVMVAIIKQFAPFNPPWYMRIFYYIKYRIQYLRMVVIGY